MPLFTGEKKRKLLMDISSFLGFCSALSSFRLYCTFPVVSELLACFVSWVQSQTYLCKEMLSTLTVTALDRDFLSAAYLHSVLCRAPCLGLLWLC